MRGKHIYVLDNSFTEADVEYFYGISENTKCGCDFESIFTFDYLDKGILAGILLGNGVGDERLFDMIKLSILYAINHRNGLFPEVENIVVYRMTNEDETLYGMLAIIQKMTKSELRRR